MILGSIYPNGFNQLTSAGGNTLSYGPNANLASNGNTSFTYDTENWLVAASGQNEADLPYDPFGRPFVLEDGNGTVTVNGKTVPGNGAEVRGTLRCVF